MTDPLAVALSEAVRGRDLAPAQMEAAMERILSGGASPAGIAALAVALRMKRESTAELVAAARVMRRHAAPWPARAGDGRVVLDTCGTGGDGASTFNISTTAAIVVAACGVRVAKHGNRAVSSRSGSADVLEALGVRLERDPARAAADLEARSIAFLFAPAFHGALRHAAPVRRELGLRTFFNLLGPLANPAGASHQLLGIYDGARVRAIAEVLGGLGVRGAWVVHGASGLDEVDPSGPTHVAALIDGEVTERTVEPRDFGLEPVPLEAIVGGDAARNAAITRAVLRGEPGAPRTATLLNAAAALCACDPTLAPRDAAARAAEAIDAGRASALLADWAAASGAAG